MNRNSQMHFATTPTVDIGRSKFDRSFTHKTTFSAGSLIPFYVDAGIMPGDSVKMNTSQVVRMMTPIAPVMDNANLDTYFFFVPYRLIWEHWNEFMGENKTEPWTQTHEYEIPQIVAPEGGWTKGSLADYMGFPTKVDGFKASALPFRAYALIWNEWFRDQNLKNPCYIHMGDADLNGLDILSSTDYVTDVEKGAVPCKVAKYHDLFTSCLPNSQKGPSVMIPLGQEAPVQWSTNGIAEADQDSALAGKDAAMSISVNQQNVYYGYIENDSLIKATGGKFSTMVTDLSAAVGATVNQLRQAFQIQKFYEKQALYGWACA